MTEKNYFLVSILLITTVLVSGCSSQTNYTSTQKQSAIQMMSVAFEGGYTESEIKPKINRAMNMYGLSLTENNYSRAGSVLVTMRKEFGVREMDVLNYMIDSYVPGVNMSFADMAGIATAFLAANK